MAKDILIVDDIKTSLSNYARDVRLNLGIEPFEADNPLKALDILRFYPIKVLVTDQEMPEMLGTELIKRAKQELGLNIPCIMLTGHTDKVSVVDAVNLGFFRFIDKQNVRNELTPAIRSAIQQYDFEMQKDSTLLVNEIIFEKKKNLFRRDNNKIKLVRISSVINTFVYEGDWKTEYVASRNVSQQKEINFRKKVKTIRESGIETSLYNKLNLKPTLLASLSSTLEGKIAINSKFSEEEELEYFVKHIIEVKEITDTKTPEGLILASREYQFAPVYNRINLILEADCTFCNIKKQFDLSLDVLTDRVALRQIEHFDKGQPSVIYTGFLNYEVESEKNKGLDTSTIREKQTPNA